MAQEASTAPATESGKADQRLPESVTLHFLSPSPDVPNGRITLANVKLETRVGELKAMLLQQWAEAPLPSRQRFIHRGRPLLNMEATLRSVLQPELETTPRPDTFTIHLVTNAPNPLPNPLVATAPHGLPSPPTLQQINRSLAGSPQILPQGLHTANHFPNQPQPPQNATPRHQSEQQLRQELAAIQQQQRMIQNQMVQHQNFRNAFDQSIDQQRAQNHNALTTIEHRIGQFQNTIDATEQLIHSLPGIPQQTPQTQPNSLPNFQSFLAQQQQQRAMGAMQGIPFPGQINNNAAANVPHVALNGHGGPGPHRSTTVQDMVGPNGQRMRVTTAVETIVVSRSGTPQPNPAGPQAMNPAGVNGSENPATMQLSQPSTTQPSQASQPSTTNPSQTSTTQPSQPSTIQTPQPSTTSNHSTMVPNPLNPLVPPFMSLPPVMSQLPQVRAPVPRLAAPDTATAWLLSGPTGPQAILFSPEHGMFGSQVTHTRGLQLNYPGRIPGTTSTRLRNLQPRLRQQQQQQQQEQAQPRNEAAPLVVRRRIEIQPNQDFLALLVRRLWLFVRLYLFSMMFTEPGTWLRWAVLAGAVLYCCCPPNTFLQDWIRRLQGHLEGLVPLAAPPGGRPRQQNNNNADNRIEARGESQRQQATPTQSNEGQRRNPQDVARRMVQQHHERNNTWWRENFDRVERSLALFVASLVPGVGERHIRARHEAEAARQAAEREDEEANQAPNAAVTAGSNEQASAANDEHVQGEPARDPLALVGESAERL